MSEQEFNHNNPMENGGTPNENGCTYHGPATEPTYQAQPNGQYQQTGATPPPYGGQQSGYTSYNGGPYNGNPGYNYDPQQQKQAKKAKKSKKPMTMTTGRVVALGLACALVGGCVGGGGVLLGSALAGGNDGGLAASNATALVKSSRTSALETAQYDTTGQSMTPSQIYNANVNSCVGISATTTYNVWGFTSSAAVSGSGFVLTEDGYIVTNYHVVENTDANSITVNLYDGSSYSAVLVGYDGSNDIAVLNVDAEGLAPVVIGSSDDLSVGDSVVAIGNPLGELTFSLTAGCVSALDREVTLESGTMNLIQTDAAINSGNSGGPLFNEYGEVVGVTNAKYSASGSSSEASVDNIGFAIPIDSVMNIIESIIEKGYVVKPYLGVTLQDYGIRDSAGNVTYGAMIYSVVDGEAAANAGLTRGDLITAIDGQEVTSSSDATAIVGKHSPGDTITITIDRNGEAMDVTVTLGERQESTTPDSQNQTSSGNSSGNSGGYYGFNPFSGSGF